MEESNDLTLVGLAIVEEEAAKSWVDEYYRKLIHNSTPHTSSSATSSGNENWGK